MVLFYNLMTVISEEIIHRHRNIWPRLHPDCARVQVTSLAIETSVAEKVGLGRGGGGFIISLAARASYRLGRNLNISFSVAFCIFIQQI
jgi:hypothetical protein